MIYNPTDFDEKLFVISIGIQSTLDLLATPGKSSTDISNISDYKLLNISSIILIAKATFFCETLDVFMKKKENAHSKMCAKFNFGRVKNL